MYYIYVEKATYTVAHHVVVSVLQTSRGISRSTKSIGPRSEAYGVGPTSIVVVVVVLPLTADEESIVIAPHAAGRCDTHIFNPGPGHVETTLARWQ